MILASVQSTHAHAHKSSCLVRHSSPLYILTSTLTEPESKKAEKMLTACGGASLPPLLRNWIAATVLALLIGASVGLRLEGPSGFSPSLSGKDALRMPLESDLVEHPAITIHNDSELAIQGWPGNGSESNPYVISNLNVTANGTCIAIMNTRAYVLVNQCMFNRAAPDDGNSIFLGNVTHCSVTDCQIVGGSLVLDHSYYCSITRTNVSGCVEGMYLYAVSFTNVTENRVHHCATGIKCRLVAGNLVMHNDVLRCGSGIHSDFENDDYPSFYQSNTISNCTRGLHIENGGMFRYNAIHDCHTAVTIRFGHLSVVANNSIDTFSHYGIYADWAHMSTISNNSISGGSTAGIVLQHSEECVTKDNLLTGCGLSLGEFHLSDNARYRTNTIVGNLVNGKSLVCVSDLSGGVIDMADYGQLIAVNCSNLVLTGGFFENVCDAVLLAYCTSIQIFSIMAVGVTSRRQLSDRAALSQG